VLIIQSAKHVRLAKRLCLILEDPIGDQAKLSAVRKGRCSLKKSINLSLNPLLSLPTSFCYVIPVKLARRHLHRRSHLASVVADGNPKVIADDDYYYGKIVSSG